MVKEDTTWNACKTDEELDIELSQTKKGIDFQENKSKASPEMNEQKSEKELKIELSQTKKGIHSQEYESKTSPERNEQKSEEKELKIELSIIFGQESEDNKVQNSQGNDEQDSDKYKKGDESPLFLATISNILRFWKKYSSIIPRRLSILTKREGTSYNWQSFTVIRKFLIWW